MKKTARKGKVQKMAKKEWNDLFPMTVDKLNISNSEELFKQPLLGRCKIGDLVAVNPCGEEYGGKTYVGFMLGDAPLSLGASYDEKKRVLDFHYSFRNPCMFVPELGEIVWGCGSWWHRIEKPEDLKAITKEDIDNVWYVKLMKAMMTKTDKQS